MIVSIILTSFLVLSKVLLCLSTILCLFKSVTPEASIDVPSLPCISNIGYIIDIPDAALIVCLFLGDLDFLGE